MFWNLFTMQAQGQPLRVCAALHFAPRVPCLPHSNPVPLSTSKALWGDPAYKGFSINQEKTTFHLSMRIPTGAGFLSTWGHTPQGVNFFWPGIASSCRAAPPDQSLSDHSHVYHNKPFTKLLKNKLLTYSCFLIKKFRSTKNIKISPLNATTQK